MHTLVHRPHPEVDSAAAAGGGGRRRAGAGRLVALCAVFVVAVTFVAAGIGLAIPHLSKEGLVPEAWLGLGLLALGVVAIGWAVPRAMFGVRRRWWLLLLPLLLVTTYVALWTVGQAVAASHPAHPELGERTPATLGLPYREVMLRTSDGVDLAAWWVPSRNGAAVALLHGAGSTRTAVLEQAGVLAEAGYGVLLVDARGHGESGGQGMDFGWYGERDAAAAVDFLTTRRGVTDDRVGLLGLSMGGESAVGAAGVDPRVRAVVAEGATNRVAADKAFLDEYGVRGDLQQGIDTLTYAVTDLLTDAPEPASLLDSVRETQRDGTPTPVLLVAAGDVETEQLAAAHIASAAPDAVRTWTVPGARHTGGLTTAPGAWRQHVLGFLEDALRDTSASGDGH